VIGYNIIDILLILLFGGLISLIPLLVILQHVLGATNESYASEEKVAIWNDLSKVYQFPNSGDLAELAKALTSFGLKSTEVRKIIETEVGPVCFARIALKGNLDWDRTWLKEKILRWRKACQFLRAIPFLGFLFSRTVIHWRWWTMIRLIDEMERLEG
jgi:hypothetical protein